MFKYYCRKYDCTVIWYPGGTAEALGKNAKQAEYKYEIACAMLQTKIIDALAANDEGKSVHQVTADTVKAYVKALYREGQVVQGS